MMIIMCNDKNDNNNINPGSIYIKFYFFENSFSIV